MVLLAWPLVFCVGWFFGLSVLLALFCLFFSLLAIPFCIPPVYLWEPCYLLFNILLLLIKKKKKFLKTMLTLNKG